MRLRLAWLWPCAEQAHHRASFLGRQVLMVGQFLQRKKPPFALDQEATNVILPPKARTTQI